ncbi:hypothetical protein [Synechocystis sp. LKSZ1]|uniref:hypothetical protein n=1 Tax=Synechocystis sp. LKSZ1 TaxID=3144951 RepID=UPI00336C1AB0
MKEKNPVIEDLKKACYCEIIPHIEEWSKTPADTSSDFDKCIYLMDSNHYRRFAENACRSCSNVTFGVLSWIYKNTANETSLANSLQEYQLNNLDLAEIRNHLYSCTKSFFPVLQNYERLMANYKCKLQDAGKRSENHGAGWGLLGAAIGGALLGPLGAMLGGYGGGYVGADIIYKEIRQDWSAILNTFRSMIDEYDNFANKIINESYQVMLNYQDILEEGVKQIKEKRRTVSQFNIEDVPKDEPLFLDISNVNSNASQVQSNGQYKMCPMCAEYVRLSARICRFCRHEFS